MFKVILKEGIAIKEFNTKNGTLRIKNYDIFFDNYGAYILIKNMKEYLTEKNCIII